MSHPEVIPFSAEAQRPSLRLVSHGPRVGPQSSLRDCWEVYVLPDLCDLKPATIEEYQNTLTLWERLTTNPPVSLIDKQLLREFQQKLLTEPYRRGKSRIKRYRTHATVNKAIRHLKAMIGPLQPADRRNGDGKGFIPFVKLPKPLDRQKKLPITFSREQMTALYEAAEAANISGSHRTTHVNNPILWRTALVLALNTGPRKFDLLSITWDDIRWDDFKFGSVYYKANKTAKLQRPPLNFCSRIHLRYVQYLRLDPVYVFPGFWKGNSAIDRAWDRITKAAKIVLPFETFRKTCSTLHNDVHHDIGRWLTGHAGRDVNEQYYDNPTFRCCEGVEKLEQPPGYRQGTEKVLALLETLGIAS